MGEAGFLTILTIALFVICGGFLAWFLLSRHGLRALSQETYGELPVDAQFMYGPDTVYRHMVSYGENGRKSFRLCLLVDMVYPLFYVAAFLCLTQLFLDFSVVPLLYADAVRCLILIAAVSDYAENILLLKIIKAFPTHRNGLVHATSLCTLIKMMTSTLCVLLGLLALIWWIVS